MLERYQIGRQLSDDGSKRTYLAVDSETKKKVVIKISYFYEPASEEDLEQLVTEAETLKNLSHPNVPNYLDCFKIEAEKHQDFLKGYSYGYALVQVYVNAPSLAELIDRGVKFSETETIQLAKNILNILDYLHGQNPPVIHQNLKPSNILLTNRSGNQIGDVYLVNFGLEATPSEKKRKEQYALTSCACIVIDSDFIYTCREQQTYGRISFASDLYSLTMTLIHLVTDTHPWSLFRSGFIEKAILDRSKISRSFSHWLNKLADPDVKNRSKSAAVALEELHSVNAGKFLSSKPKSSQIKLNISRQKLEIIYPVPSQITSWRWLYLPILFTLLCSIAIYSIIAFGSSLLPILYLFSLIHGKLYKYRIIQITKKPPNIMEGFYQGILIKIIYEKTVRLLIKQVIYRPSYTYNEYPDRSRWSASKTRIKVDAKLSLLSDYRGTEVFSLQEVKTKSVEITEADLLWLGDEICDFLDLRLQIVSPTPKAVSTAKQKK